MSMLGEQIKELREAARNIQGNLGRCLYRRKDVDEMQQVSDLLFEAADTIEGLRDRLQCERHEVKIGELEELVLDLYADLMEYGCTPNAHRANYKPRFETFGIEVSDDVQVR